jgi:hypothetical protein
LELEFDNGDFSGPIATPMTEEILVLNRGLADSHMHYIEGPDDAMMAPVDITFTALIEDTTITTDLLDWLKAMTDALATTVSGQTLVSTETDTQRDGANNNPAFRDANKSTCNVEYFLDGAVDIVWHYNEVWFPPDQQSISEAEDGVTVSLTGRCYGTIVRDTAFTAGTDVTA